jgi:anthranilate/para-aminobenzoate synthase component I
MIREIAYSGSAFELYLSMRKAGTPSVLLESVQNAGRSGRYSFIGTKPSRIVRCDGASPDPFERTRKLLHSKRTERIPGGPPFLGGAVGFVSYEAGRVEVRAFLPAGMSWDDAQQELHRRVTGAGAEGAHV